MKIAVFIRPKSRHLEEGMSDTVTITRGSAVLEEAIDVYKSGLCANSARSYQARIGQVHGGPQVLSGQKYTLD
jgi:hypothetical protein